MYNNTGSSVSYSVTYPDTDTITVPPGLMVLIPDSSSNKSVVQWTAPATATFTVQGNFGPGSGDCAPYISIVLTSPTLTTPLSLFSGQGCGSSFNIVRAMNAGDTLDFIAGHGYF
jgi:hypothetical protein